MYYSFPFFEFRYVVEYPISVEAILTFKVNVDLLEALKLLIDLSKRAVAVWAVAVSYAVEFRL
jgi:hypothetical protein